MRPSRLLVRSSVVDSPWPAARSVPVSVTVWPVLPTSRVWLVSRRPKGRLQTIFFLTVGLVEAMFFINLAFMALFVFVLGK